MSTWCGSDKRETLTYRKVWREREPRAVQLQRVSITGGWRRERSSEREREREREGAIGTERESESESEREREGERERETWLHGREQEIDM